MARKKAWTKKKRQKAARKGAVTRKQRAKKIQLAHQSDRTGFVFLIPFGTWVKDSIKLPQRVAAMLSLQKGEKSLFKVPDIVTGIVLMFQTGVTHFSHLNQLVPEVKLAQSIGLDHFFGETTATDLLKQAQPVHIKEVEKLLRTLCFQRVHEERGEIEVALTPEEMTEAEAMDVVVDTSGHPSDSRKREQVKAGYCNGKKKELCLKHGRVVVNGRPVSVAVYPGNENPKEPFRKGLAVVPLLCRRYPDRVIHFRSDSGFASEAHRQQLKAMEKKYPNFRYTVGIAIPNPHSQPAQTAQQAIARRKKQWKRINEQSRVTDMGYGKVYSDSPDKTRQIVVERTEKKTIRKGKARGKVRVVEKKRYYVIATNYHTPELKARGVFHRYHDGTVIEASIKDGKQSYQLKHLPHQKFNVNRMYLLLATLAQLLGIIYSQMLLPKETARPLMATVRADVWRIGGCLLGARHIVLDVVYRRLKWIQQACLAVKLQLGYSIDMPELDSS